MSITEADVKKIAHLARLTVKEEDVPQLRTQMEDILNLVAKMDAYNTKDVMPLAHSSDATQPLRVDEITETNQRELVQKIAPHIFMGLYIVPQVIGE